MERLDDSVIRRQSDADASRKIGESIMLLLRSNENVEVVFHLLFTSSRLTCAAAAATRAVQPPTKALKLKTSQIARQIKTFWKEEITNNRREGGLDKCRFDEAEALVVAYRHFVKNCKIDRHHRHTNPNEYRALILFKFVEPFSDHHFPEFLTRFDFKRMRTPEMCLRCLMDVFWRLDHSSMFDDLFKWGMKLFEEAGMPDACALLQAKYAEILAEAHGENHYRRLEWRPCDGNMKNIEVNKREIEERLNGVSNSNDNDVNVGPPFKHFLHKARMKRAMYQYGDGGGVNFDGFNRAMKYAERAADAVSESLKEHSSTGQTGNNTSNGTCLLPLNFYQYRLYGFLFELMQHVYYSPSPTNGPTSSSSTSSQRDMKELLSSLKRKVEKERLNVTDANDSRSPTMPVVQQQDLIQILRRRSAALIKLIDQYIKTGRELDRSEVLNKTWFTDDLYQDIFFRVVLIEMTSAARQRRQQPLKKINHTTKNLERNRSSTAQSYNKGKKRNRSSTAQSHHKSHHNLAPGNETVPQQLYPEQPHTYAVPHSLPRPPDQSYPQHQPQQLIQQQQQGAPLKWPVNRSSTAQSHHESHYNLAPGNETVPQQLYPEQPHTYVVPHSLPRPSDQFYPQHQPQQQIQQQPSGVGKKYTDDGRYQYEPYKRFYPARSP